MTMPAVWRSLRLPAVDFRTYSSAATTISSAQHPVPETLRGNTNGPRGRRRERRARRLVSETCFARWRSKFARWESVILRYYTQKYRVLRASCAGMAQEQRKDFF